MDIIEHLEKLRQNEAFAAADPMFIPVIDCALAEIHQLRSAAGAVTPGPSLREIKDDIPFDVKPDEAANPEEKT